MADQSPLDQALEEVERTVELYKSVEAVPLPRNLKEALEQKWELTFGGIEFGVLLAYDGELQREHVQRVIKLDDAIKYLYQQEDEYVRTLVIRPDSLVGGVLKATQSLLTIVWNTLKTLWKVFQTLGFEPFMKLLKSAYDHILLVVSVTLIVTTGKRVFGERDAQQIQMRKRALPQRTVPRYSRRRVSRR